jgi:hypothetical protein
VIERIMRESVMDPAAIEQTELRMKFIPEGEKVLTESFF